ncbi:MAG: hypothetical protein GTO63_07115 [Anaerolineae bacterium]|nr:hypothetical protein [Anaerolineae bacterium]NIN94698.1 hypothetical protein [Anaerolineae bacterium]NIQ77760.1 hypothetical protein [Anaerolineae bacterium]
MIRLCLNCDTENPGDAVICSGCGMSLTRAPVGETAEKAREGQQLGRFVTSAAQPRPGQAMRNIARILALVWAGCWTVLIGLIARDFVRMSLGGTYLGSRPYESVLYGIGLACLPGLPVLVIVWTSAVIPWRWEGAGGAVLVAEGLLLLVPVALTVCGALSAVDSLFVLIPLLPGLLPLVAGVLFLASWRESRTLEAPQDSE